MKPEHVPPAAYARREKVYADMTRLTEATGKPAVMIVVDGIESHVQVTTPGADDLEQVYLTAQKAQYTLALWLEHVGQQLAEAKTPAKKS